MYHKLRGYILLLMNLLISSVLFGQEYFPVINTGSSINYLSTWTATAPITDSSVISGKPLQDVKQVIQYYDGLGRPVQNVSKQGSLITGGSPTDLVSPNVYDEFGREVYKYLPYASNGVNGAVKFNSLQEQKSFFTGSASPLSGQNENYYYSEMEYESSPLNKIIKMMPPGKSWVGNDVGVKKMYLTNTNIDAVRKWDVQIATTFGTLSSYTSNGIYPAGQLFKYITVDEAGHQVVEFKDKDDRTVLKKVQLTAAADAGIGSAHTGWLCTYYIYDDLGNLRCVIQPQGVQTMNAANNWSLTYNASLLPEQCFRYEYDQYNRMIIKQVPGAAAVYMVYDARDRLVMTQDGNLRGQNKWIATKYDNLNRPDTTWLDSLPSSTTFNALLTAAAASTTDYPAPGGITATNLLTATHYDDYTGTTFPTGVSGTYKSTWNNYLLTASNTAFPYPVTPTQVSIAATKGLVTWIQTRVLNSNPLIFITSVNIYDDKGRVIQTQSNNITGGAEINTVQYTWAGQPLVSVNWQSKLGTMSDTSLTVTKMTYDSLNRLVKTEMKQGNTKWGNKSLTLPAAFTTLSTIAYDAVGQVKTKTLGNKRTSISGNPYDYTKPLETQAFEYNVRGWLLGVNRAYARDAGSTDSTTTTTITQTMGGEMFTESISTLATVTYPNTNYFGFDLGYDKTNNNLIKGKTYTAAQYTGNITGMVWKGANDKKVRIYNFTYDNVNRLTAANFGQYKSGGFSSANVNYTVNNLSYDNNGNIKSMNQYGLKTGNTSAIIDQLAYNYPTASNKLTNVIDTANDANSTLGDYHYSGTKTSATVDYEYDANGNLHLDHNKHLTITYNYLNLPQSIAVTDKGTITYYYDAAGNKVKKVTVDNTATPARTTTTLYIGGSVYQNDTLQFFGTAEGRTRPNAANTAFVYDYFLKDHLGNTRMVITDDYNVASPILEATSYYPFGLQQRGIGLQQEKTPLHNKKLFNEGTELQEDFDINLYAADYRSLDPQLGRFLQIDPDADLMEDLSPFNYAANNPILINDPLGLDTLIKTKDRDGQGNIIYEGENKTQDVTVTASSSKSTNNISTFAPAFPLQGVRSIPKVRAPLPNPFLLIFLMLIYPSNFNQYLHPPPGNEMAGLNRLHAEVQQQQEKTWQGILNDSELGDETKGRTKQHDKKGDYKTAEEDFDKLYPTNVQPLGNSKFRGKWGYLHDGSKIIVRDGSKGKDGQIGQPTLERQYDNRKIKIRYN